MTEGETRKPKKVMGDTKDGQFQFAWNSTPKYPKGYDNGRSSEGYGEPIKKLHTMKNYEISSQSKKKR